LEIKLNTPHPHQLDTLSYLCRMTSILQAAEAFVREHYRSRVPSDRYTFHDIRHTENVVLAVQELMEAYSFSEEEQLHLLLAAWFHDTGYDQGPEGHEKRSCEYARSFLGKKNTTQQAPEVFPPLNEKALDQICACIMATKIPQQPRTLAEQLLCDADLSHLGKRNYWERCGKLRQELALTQNRIMSDEEWIAFELDFMQKHHYHTAIAMELYDKRKQKYIRQLYKQRKRLLAGLQMAEGIKPAKASQKKDKNKRRQEAEKVNGDGESAELKQLRLGRGVETMFRTTYRTHINLSSMADNKANIMLSINAIIISIVVSTLVPSFDDTPRLILPTVILLTVCLLAMIFATLSTKPKITEGKFTPEDIEKKRGNLLFFGNYYNMDMDVFHWGMMEMIKDSDYLYSSMTRDLYFLGKVLAKKYRYLSICYTIFMYGIIAAVAAFGLAFLL